MAEETPFTIATASQYVAAYGEPEPEFANLLSGQLARASRIVRDELAADGHDIEAMIASGDVKADTAADVVIDMVAYAYRTGSAANTLPMGATTATVSAGPYSESATYPTPTGSLSFTRVHRRRLGIGSKGAHEVDLTVNSRPMAPGHRGWFI